MRSVTPRQGRLPRRVYWVRRTLVLAVALLLVFGIGKLVGATGADEPGSSLEASTSSAQEQQSSAPSVTLGPVAPTGKLRAKAKVPLAMPSGECRDDEITVLPSVPQAWAGGPIELVLELSGTEPACTFEASPETIGVKITSGEDDIWSSQHCDKGIETATVVVRSGHPVEVPVTWNGRRSDEDCTAKLDWALPGFYHLHAAVLGSTPNDVPFEITVAPARIRTATPRPRPSASQDATASTTPSPEAEPSTTPTRRP